jgi:hypothetical protein
MAQSFTNLIYHIVFSTKDRQPLIADAHQSRLYEYIGGTIRELGGISPFPSMDAPSIADRLGWRGNRDRM